MQKRPESPKKDKSENKEQSKTKPKKNGKKKTSKKKRRREESSSASIKKSKSEYATAGGLYTTSKQGTLTFKLPKFSNSKDITWSMDMDNGKLEELGYDMIIGRDLLLSLGMIIDFKYSVIRWGENNIPMNRTKLAKNDQKN